MESNGTFKSLIIVHSYHHNNTSRIAEEISKVLDAEIIRTNEKIKLPIKTYDLIGFGSGIDSGKHYQSILDFADRLPNLNNQKCFIFSTSGVQGLKKVKKDHETLRKKLIEKGFVVIGEFSCKGYNTNSFLKFIGGMNKGRPNDDDLMNAKEFAKGMQEKIEVFE